MKKLTALFLALALCLGLAVPAFAAEGDVTTITDENGFAYNLSKPLVGTDVLAKGMHYLDDEMQQLATNVKLYLIEEGTIITPKDPIGTPKKEDESGTTYYLTDEQGLKEVGPSDDPAYVLEDFSVSFFPLYGIYDGGNDEGGRDGLWMLEPLGGNLDGVDWDGEPIQPLKADEFNGLYVLDRMLSYSHSSVGGGGAAGLRKESYAYIQVLTAEEAAQYRAEHGQEPTPPSFTDVKAGDWYADAVNWAVSQKITTGTSKTKFSPEEKCTHIQILTFLYRAVEKIANPNGEDMEKAVAWAREKGMLAADFDRQKQCTRAEAVTYIWQAMGKEDAPASSFIDVDPNAGYAKAVDWAVANGVTNGTNTAQTEFSPNRVCDRGTIVTFLHRAYVPEARLK